jgi:hypothetical protein
LQLNASQVRLEAWQGLKAHARLIDVIGTAESRALLQSSEHNFQQAVENWREAAPSAESSGSSFDPECSASLLSRG